MTKILGGKNTGLPSTKPLCYVELKGNFTFSGPPSPNHPQGTTVTHNTGFRVFDAKTGNLMLTGGFDAPARQR